MKRIFLSLITIGFIAISFAQQDPQFSMYMFNGQYINAAYAGSKEALDVSGIYRYQWAGNNFDGGAPQSANIGIHTPFKKNQYALGVLIGHDHIGSTDMYNLTAQFSYRISVKESKISLGIQSGFYHFNDNRDNLREIDTDDLLTYSERSLYLPNVGAGIYVYGKRYYIGLSMPHILNMNLSEKLQNAGTNSDISRQYRHLFFTLGGVFGRENAVVKFKPSMLAKYVGGQPNNIPDFDFNMSFLFVDRLWLGASVRTGGDEIGPYFSDIVGMVEFLITPQLRAGYAYDYQLSDLNRVSSGSHEVMLGYQFGYKKKKFVDVRYGTYF